MVILCVDDEHTALQVRTALLSAAGYRVLAASSGECAMKSFAMNRPDLVIIDQFLHDMSGLEVIAQMKRMRPEVPILLLTGLTEQEPGWEAADLFLTKGITPPEFLAQVRKLLARPDSSCGAA